MQKKNKYISFAIIILAIIILGFFLVSRFEALKALFYSILTAFLASGLLATFIVLGNQKYQQHKTEQRIKGLIKEELFNNRARLNSSYNNLEVKNKPVFNFLDCSILQTAMQSGAILNLAYKEIEPLKYYKSRLNVYNDMLREKSQKDSLSQDDILNDILYEIRAVLKQITASLEAMGFDKELGKRDLDLIDSHIHGRLPREARDKLYGLELKRRR